MDKWIVYKYEKEEIRTHPLYRRELGLHLHWTRRGFLPVHFSVIYAAVCLTMVFVASFILNVNPISAFGFASLFSVIYYTSWDYLREGRLRRHIHTGFLNELNTTNMPSLNFSAYCLAHSKMLGVVAVFLILFLLVSLFMILLASFISPSGDFPRFLVFLIPFFLCFFALSLYNVFEKTDQHTTPLIRVSTLRFASMVQQRKPVAIILIDSIFVIPAILLILIAHPIALYLLFPISVIPLFLERSRASYAYLSRQNWEDLLLRFSQGETPDPREYR